MKEILDELPYGPGPDFKINVNPKFRGSLTQAISLYSNSRKEALKDVYDKKDIDLERSPETQADFEEVAASCGHFSFSLLEFAEQLKEYLDILDELQLEVEELPTGRSWEWLKFWRSGRVKPDSERRDSCKSDPLVSGMQSTNTQYPQPTSSIALTTLINKSMRLPLSQGLF